MKDAAVEPTECFLSAPGTNGLDTVRVMMLASAARSGTRTDVVVRDAHRVGSDSDGP